jgi:hypothetical protein
MEKQLVRNHRDLDVYKMAFETAMQMFDKSRSFPIKVVAGSEATLKGVIGWGLCSLSPYLPITPF